MLLLHLAEPKLLLLLLLVGMLLHKCARRHVRHKLHAEPLCLLLLLLLLLRLLLLVVPCAAGSAAAAC